METVHAPDMYVVVGDEFAKRLGYEELVGSMGVIDDVMSALCGVTIITGKQEAVGRQYDIHLQDCIIQEQEQENRYAVLINLDTGVIFYSNNVELVEYAKKCLFTYRLKEMRNIPDMSEIVDHCNEHLESTRAKRDFEWIIHCLDDRGDEVSLPFLETYEADVAAKEAQTEAFRAQMLIKKELSPLAASLKKQMDEKKTNVVPYEFKELKEAYQNDDDDGYTV